MQPGPSVLPLQQPSISPPQQLSSLPFLQPESGVLPPLDLRVSPPQEPSILSSIKPTVKCNSRNILRKKFGNKNLAASSFPSVPSDSTTCQAIQRFQNYIARIKANTEQICASCGLTTPLESTSFLHKTDSLFQRCIDRQIFSEATLDNCGQRDNNFSFCQKCFNSISSFKPAKFEAFNFINTTFCQLYPSALDDLTLVEEAVIARAHPVISILKLRPAGVGPAVTYQRVRGHVVVLPQNPGLLLSILPSRSLILHDVVRIAWASKQTHTAADIQPFVKVRQERVLVALQWLRQNNPLYCDITINLDFLQEWEDEFVPTGIADEVLHCEADSTEKQGYAADLETDNFENDLQQAMDDASLNAVGMTGGCLYTDVDNIREHPTSKLLSAVANRNMLDESTRADVPPLTYRTKRHAIPLNDWDDSFFFQLHFQRCFLLVSEDISRIIVMYERFQCHLKHGLNGH